MTMIENNICLLSDSYKEWHHRAYLPNTEYLESYFEARNGARFNKTVLFGLQAIIKKHLVGQVVTKEKIDEAERLVNAHQGPVFNREGWEYILSKHDGQLPITIRAVAEGTPVDVNNAMMVVRNNDKECKWLTNYLESLLLHVWYPSTVATLSREIKFMLIDYMNKTSDDFSGLDFMLHDFGFRGVETCDAAMIGGAGHLLNFKGTDTVPALLIPINYYSASGPVGFSVAATEHSIMTARGREGEFEVVEHIFKETPSGILSLVIDSYDYENFINVCGTTFKDTIDKRDGRTVFRPDSGDPVTVTLRCLELIEKYWGSTKNSKGFRVLPPHVRVLWGDGIDYYGMRTILFSMLNNGWSAENIVFGCGGGLLQKVDRDTQRFAFKCSAQYYDGAWHDVYKEPKDLTKKSKRGRLALIEEDGKHVTVRLDELNGRKDLLKTVFENGRMVREYTWEEVVHNARLFTNKTEENA
nr:MAG TPA: putative nicotinate phosphoribosyltransferase [Caudoviricetes sp.]